MKKFKKCQDSRCLFSTNEESLPTECTLVTTKTREGEGLWEKCKHCNLVINRSGVEKKEVEDFYNKTYVEKNSYSKGELLTARQHFEVGLNSLRPLSQLLIPHLKKDMRVFELGGATGELLYLIKDHVKSCYNNEINNLYTEFAKQELGIDGSSQDYFSLEFPEKFDCILSINTIDHMYYTGRAVEKIFNDLKPGGIAYIEVPNDNQALKTFLPEETREKFQKFMYQKAHYYSFTSETLTKLIKQEGFEVVEEFSRHDYSFINYLQWYFLGAPQKRQMDAKGKSLLHDDESTYAQEMNQMIQKVDKEFQEIITRNKRGELLGILCKKPE